MRRILVLILLAALMSPAWADEAAAWAALRSGRAVVALMRHADAPGAGDPPGWRLDDCSTQRNLSAQGRADARAVGDRFRAEGIRVAKVLSSPWCRCMDTATLLQLGPVEAEQTFGNVVVLSDQRESLTAGARAVIDKWTGSGILLVVTHGANIFALTGISPASGEIVVVRSGSGGGGSSESVGRLILD